MGLKTADLPVALLNKLSSLEELDLSGNMLQKLPAGLCLPRLRLLNFSNNDMEEVTSLETLSGLEELRLDDNLYLTVRHKLLTCGLRTWHCSCAFLFIYFYFDFCRSAMSTKWCSSCTNWRSWTGRTSVRRRTTSATSTARFLGSGWVWRAFFVCVCN